MPDNFNRQCGGYGSKGGQEATGDCGGGRRQSDDAALGSLEKGSKRSGRFFFEEGKLFWVRMSIVHSTLCTLHCVPTTEFLAIGSLLTLPQA